MKKRRIESFRHKIFKEKVYIFTGIIHNMRHFTKEEIDFLLEFYPINGAKFCSEKLNRNPHSVDSKCSRLGIKKERGSINFDLNIFYDIKRADIAYLLGLIWADASFSVDNRAIRLEIIESDGVYFYEYVKNVGNIKISKRRRKNRKSTMMCLAFNCAILSRYLIENDYRIKSLASPTKILSKIPEHLRHYFWLGYSDGDGCFYTEKAMCQFCLSGNYDQNWEDFEKLLNNLNIRYKIKRNITKKGHKYSSIRITSRYDIDKLGEYFYQDRKDLNIGLERKYLKYLQIKEKVRQSVLNKLSSEVRAPDSK